MSALTGILEIASNDPDSPKQFPMRGESIFEVGLSFASIQGSGTKPGLEFNIVNNNFTQPIGVQSLSLTPDGLYVIATGTFTEINGGAQNRIAKFDLTGVPEDTFNTAVGTGFSTSGDDIQSIILSDGGILCFRQVTDFDGTSLAFLCKLTSAGALDTDFLTNLGSGFDNRIFGACELSDGRIALVGQFTTFNGNTRKSMVMLNADGTEDAAFYSALGTGFSSTVSVHSVVQLSTGDLIIVGQFTSFASTSAWKVLKLSSAGVQDTMFTTNNGTSFTSGAPGGAKLFKVLVQDDDKVVCFGQFTSFDSNSCAHVARLNSDGTYDSAFGANYLASGIGPSSTTNGILTANSQIVFSEGSSPYVYRLNADGTEDTAFATNLPEIVTGPSTTTYFAGPIVELPDGSYIVGGNIVAVDTSGVYTRGSVVAIRQDGSENIANFYGGPAYDYLTGVAGVSNESYLASVDPDGWGIIDARAVQITLTKPAAIIGVQYRVTIPVQSGLIAGALSSDDPFVVTFTATASPHTEVATPTLPPVGYRKVFSTTPTVELA